MIEAFVDNNGFRLIPVYSMGHYVVTNYLIVKS